MRKWLSFVILSSLILACSKQDTPRFTSEIYQSDRDVAQMQACLGFRPYDNQLSHAGTLKLFECSQWNVQFPELYKAVTSMDPKEWNYIMKPIDDMFFNDIEGRKKILGLLKTLEEKKALNDIGAIGRKFFKTPLITLISQTKHQAAWGKLVKLLDLPEEKREVVFRFFQAAVTTISKSEKSLKKNLAPVFALKSTQAHKNWVYDFIAKKYIEGTLATDLSVLGELYNNKSADFWFYNWVKDSKASPRKFQEIFTYTVFTSPNTSQDVQFLQKALKTGLTCVQKNQSNFVDIKPEIASIVAFLKTTNRAQLFEKQLDHKAKLSIFSNFCESIEINGTKNEDFVPVFERLFDNVQDFIGDRLQYDWIKGLHLATNVSNDPFYFIDFMAGSFFRQVEDLSRTLKEEDAETLFPAIFEIFSNVSLKDYPAIFKFMRLHSDPEVKEIFSEWMKIWLTLSDSEKQSFYDLSEVFLEKDFHTTDVLSSYIRMFSLFPNLTKDLNEAYLFDGDSAQLIKALSHVTLHLSSKKVMNELSEFYSEKHMSKVINVITYGLNSSPLAEISAQEVDDVFVPYVIKEDELKIKAYAKCVEDIRRLEKKGMAYYELIAAYPASCMQVNDGALTHKLFIWFKTIDTMYAQNYGDQYVLFDRNGILKNESLSQILNLMLVVNDSYLTSNKELGLHDLVLDLKQEILGKENYKVVEPVLRMLGNFYATDHIKLKEFYHSLISKLVKTPDYEIKRFLAPLTEYMVALKKHNLSIESAQGKKTCKDINPNLGVNPCLTTHEIKQGMRELYSFIFKNYDDAAPMLEELIALLHPSGGTEIPYPAKKNGAKHAISLEEIVRFFHHMTLENDRKTLTYKTETSTSKETIDTVSQLEIVIRDIGFLNDFYGAFFKNSVAGAKDYKKKVEKLKGQVSLMESSGGLLRKTKVFPRETEWKLSNIKDAYDSLIHVDDDFALGGKAYRYGPMMQSILAMVTKTSSPDVQKFTAFWVPNESYGLRHQGRFLNAFVGMSGMRHVAQFLENRFGKDVSNAIKADTFKRINSLPGRFTLSKLQATARKLANKYARNDQDVFYEMSDDLIEWISRLSYGELRVVEGALVNLSVILTYNDEKNLDSVLEVIEPLFELYRPLKSVWPSDRKLFDMVNDVAGFLDVIVKRIEANPEEVKWANQVFSLLKGITLGENKAGLDILVKAVKQDPKTWVKDILALVDQVKKFGNSWSLDEANHFHQTFSILISHPHLDFVGIKNWLSGSLKDPKHDLELLRLAHFLTQTISYEGKEHTRFYVALDQLLNKESQTLENLLKTASSVFSFK